MSHTHLVKTMRRKEYNHNLPIFQTCQGEVAQKSWAILLQKQKEKKKANPQVSWPFLILPRSFSRRHSMHTQLSLHTIEYYISVVLSAVKDNSQMHISLIFLCLFLKVFLLHSKTTHLCNIFLNGKPPVAFLYIHHFSISFMITSRQQQHHGKDKHQHHFSWVMVCKPCQNCVWFCCVYREFQSRFLYNMVS